MSHLGYRVEVTTHKGFVGRSYETTQYANIDDALRAYANEVERTDQADVTLIDQGVPYQQPARIVCQRLI